MAWKNSLLDASFRGVPFDVISTSDAVQKSLVQHRVPYTNGAEIEDMGANAPNLRLQIIFWGDDYENRLQDFLNAFALTGAGDLVHPVHGSMQVVPETFEEVHDADNPDSCTLNVSFVRDGFSVAPFSESSTRQKAEAALVAAEAARLASGSMFAKAIGKLKAAQGTMSAGLKRLNRLRGRALAMEGQLRSAVQGVITAGLDVINAPLGFVSDLANMADGLIDLRAFDVGIIAAQWRAQLNKISRVLRLPNDGRAADSQTKRDDFVLDLLLATQAVYSQTVLAVAIFQQQADTPTLAPAAIEGITNDVRTNIQSLVEQHQTFDDPVETLPVIEALRVTADAVQQAALALLNERPPLIERIVDSAMPLRLLAFKWYGDESRTLELLRLNPQIRHPCFMQPGDRLHAYAR